MVRKARTRQLVGALAASLAIAAVTIDPSLFGSAKSTPAFSPQAPVCPSTHDRGAS